jgi:hypothetical protein
MERNEMDQNILYLRINMENTTNGQYQLFSSNPLQPLLESVNHNYHSLSNNRSTTCSIFEIQKEKEEEIQEKILYLKLATEIETFLLEDAKMYNLTKYTYFEIDGIQANIYIYRNMDTTYGYHIISKNIEYEYNSSEEENDVDFILYEKEDFDNIPELLKHIKMIESTHTFLDFYLLPPEKMEKAKLHRTLFPLPSDKMCSVCYEPTLEYTTCHHGICLKCREKCILKKNKYCPICRKSELRYYPHELSLLDL